MIDLIAFSIGAARTFFAFLFLMFIPGLAISLVFFPGLTDISVFRRIVLSGILSIGMVIACLLILDIFLGVDITPVSILVFLLFITLFVLVIWRIEIVVMRWSQNHGARTCDRMITWCGRHNPLGSGPVSRVIMKIQGLFRRESP